MTMYIRQDVLRDQNQSPIAGANIYVYVQDGITNSKLASLTSDGTTPLDQPVVSDSFGNFKYYSAAGYYIEDIHIGSQRIWENASVAIGQPALSGAQPILASSRTALASLSGMAAGQSSLLTESGREGMFVFSTANLSSQVTADPNKAIYVAPSSDTTGASGAWVRVWDGINLQAKWLGVVADGTTDNHALIVAAFDLADALGAGTVVLPSGTCATASQINIGNGSNTAVSTKHHRIRLIGGGYGSGTDVSNTEYLGVTRILYTGSSSSTTAVVSCEGPIVAIGMENIQLDANSLAGYGLNVNHVTQGTFLRVDVRNYTVAPYNLTTRTGFPTGCSYGCGDNRFYDCYGLNAANNTAHGLILTSGVASGTTLVGNPDSARNIFIGGTLEYGGNTGSYGVYLNGADNNQFIGVEFLPKGGSSGGLDVYLDPWTGSTIFPLENCFINCGMARGVGPASGGPTGGNTFSPYPTSDGAAVPSLTSAQAKTHTGQEYINGVRAYRGRQLATYSTQTPQTIASVTEADITGYTLTVATAASTKLLIRYTARCSKDAAGTGYVIVNINGSDYGVTMRDVGATGFYQALAAEVEVDVGAGSQVVKLRFASSDTNTFHIDRGSLTVQELY